MITIELEELYFRNRIESKERELRNRFIQNKISEYTFIKEYKRIKRAKLSLKLGLIKFMN